MIFNEYGTKVIDLKIELDLNEFLIHNLLKDLQNTIYYINKTKLEILKEFIQKLTMKLKDKTDIKSSINNEQKFLEFINPYENLIEHLDLTKVAFNFFLERLEIPEIKIWEGAIENFTPKQMHQSAIEFYFCQLNTLLDILGRDEAIDYYKKIILNFIHTYDRNQLNVYKSLEDMRDSNIRFLEKGSYGRIRLISDVKNGRLIEICKNCEKVEFLDEFLRKDGELLYTICCAVHIPLAEMWNENFVLTLNHTIAKGDPYCTYVYHDTRFVDEIKQLPKDFINEVISNFE